MLLSSALLVLFLDPALADRDSNAHFLTDRFSAGHIVRGRAANFRTNPHQTTTRVDVIPNGLLMTVPNDVTAVTAEVHSDAGEEEVALVELDAWLHGSVELPALRGAEGTVELTLLDSNSMELKRFTGRLTYNARKYSWTGFTPLSRSSGTDCTSRSGCTEVVEEVDADVVGTELLDGGTGLGLDLAGADLYNVAYASVTVTEQVATCTGVYDRSNTCTEWSYLSLESTVEVGFEDVGAVWGADLSLSHRGRIENVATLYKTERNDRYRARYKAQPSWLDGASGVSVLSIDEDPLTGLGLTTVDGLPSLTVYSEGWTLGDALPIDAKVELSTGETFVIPVESYQRKAERNSPTSSEANELFGMIDSGSFRLKVNGWHHVAVVRGERSLTRSAGTGEEGAAAGADINLTLEDFDGGPLCLDGTCFTFVSNSSGGYDLTATQYRWDTDFIAGETNCVIERLDRSGEVVWEEEHSLTFGDEITAVFSSEVSFDGDAINQALAGKVSLRGTPNRKGKQSTLAKGKFYGVVTRDGDGDINLGGADKDALAAAAETDFAVLLTGASSSCGDDGSGYYGTWPRLVSVSGTGSGRGHEGVATCKKIGLACRD